MIRTTALLATALCLLTISYSQAATLIESKDGRGENTKMWLEGSAMRIDIANQPTYMLFDIEKKKMYAVDPAKREAMDMSHLFNDDKTNTPDTPVYKVQFDKQGKGPVIAGYNTVHYQTKVNGVKCTDEYLSEKAFKDIGSLEVFEALSTMANSAQKGMPMAGQDPCESVQADAMVLYQKYGYPLKMVEKDGSMKSEVIRIALKVVKPKKDFQVPDGYQVVDLGKMINDQMKYMPKRPNSQSMPQMRGNGSQEMDPAEIQRMLEQMMKSREQK